MPLRDHFDRPNWDRVLGGWPAVIVQHLFRVVPARYHLAPQIYRGHSADFGPAALDPDEYEVRIYDADEGERLVAVIEFVSPANKDRPESRRALVSKCAALHQQGVCVSIVDLVTIRQFNLYAELLESLGRSDPTMAAAHLYAVTIHRRQDSPHALQVGQPLPILPIWLNDRDCTMLDLEATYEETCRTLRVV